MALVDAECRFIYIDVGCNGRCHDAGVLLQCDLKNVLDDAENHFPADKIIGNGQKLPYVIVGDDAFPTPTTVWQRKGKFSTFVFHGKTFC